MKNEVAEALSAGSSIKYTAVGASSVGLQVVLQNISLVLSVLVGIATLAHMVYGILNRHYELKKNWARRKDERKEFEEFKKQKGRK